MLGRMNRRQFVGATIASGSWAVSSALSAQQISFAMGEFGESENPPPFPGLQEQVEQILKDSTSQPCVDIFPDDAASVLEAYEKARDANPEQNTLPEDDLAAVQAALAMPDADAGLQQEAIVQTRKLWPQGSRVTWCFLRGGRGDNTIQQACRQAIDEWQQLTCLRLTKVADDSRADIRISFMPGRGHYSLIGIDSRHYNGPGGRESLNISPGNPREYLRVARHELGHAMGMVHEHQHADGIQWNEDLVYQYFWQTQGWNREKTKRNVLDRVNRVDYSFTKDRDADSIMHYWFPAQLHRSPDVPTEPKNEISAADVRFIRGKYECVGDTPSEPDPGSPIADGPDFSQAVDLAIGAEGRAGEIVRAGASIVYRLVVTTRAQYVVETFEDDPAIAMKLTLFDAARRDAAIASNAFGGRRLLNARITRELAVGTYYVQAKHFHKTASATGRFRIRAVAGS